ncbi:MAG: S8 family serine peptidase, partial [Saprospiraceae bacterium]|nr:S8 family serine peptidase [Saprospiraceae bacterium]
HPDFRQPDDPSRSRIAYIWDQENNGGSASPKNFSYGSEWNRGQIEKDLNSDSSGLVAHLDTFSLALGHGTHIAGTAAGNKGLAYESDIVVVASDLSLAKVIDGTTYIIGKAREMNKPCVINMSFGSNLGPHDGSYVLSAVLDVILEETDSLAIVASAGNARSRALHWGGFPLQPDSLTMYAGGVGTLWMYYRLPNEFVKTMEIAVMADSARFEESSLVFEKNIGRTAWYKVEDLLREDVKKTFRYENGKVAGRLTTFSFADPQKSYTEFYIRIEDGTNPYNYTSRLEKMDLYRFMVRGEGIFDAWFSSFIPITIDDPDLAGLPNDRYRSPDNLFGVGHPGDAKNVLTVGAFTNRGTWTDANGQTSLFNPLQVTGELANFSSRGPTFDGRIKPEITAPGKGILSAIPTYVEISPSLLMESDLIRAVYQGTSFSAPVVTGAIALLFEQNPEMKFRQIKSLITETAAADSHTGSNGVLPNSFWGYGKLNVFEAALAVANPTQTRLEPEAESTFSV